MLGMREYKHSIKPTVEFKSLSIETTVTILEPSSCFGFSLVSILKDLNSNEIRSIPWFDAVIDNNLCCVDVQNQVKNYSENFTVHKNYYYLLFRLAKTGAGLLFFFKTNLELFTNAPLFVRVKLG